MKKEKTISTKREGRKKLTNKLAEIVGEAVRAEETGDEQKVMVSQLSADALLEMTDANWKNQIEYEHRFYTVELKRDGVPDIKFNLVQVLDVLKQLGFFRYDDEASGGQTIYVQIKDGRIKQIKDTKIIRDAFEDYINSLTDRNAQVDGTTVLITPSMLRAKLLATMSYTLGEDKLERLRPDEPITIMHDTYSYKYFYFNNCVVQVSAKGINQIPYTELQKFMSKVEKLTGEKNGKYIWESSILDRDFNKNALPGEFSTFCMYISGYGNIRKKIEEGRAKEITEKEKTTFEQRFISLKSILGYLMHGDYECVLKAVLFMDVNMNGGTRNNGGTGKGLLGLALSHILNRTSNDCKYIVEPGKTFDVQNERRYSNGDISTQLIHIEDLKADFKFEDFYNDVTDFLPIRKMQKDKILIKSKIMLSSNTPIDIITTGNSVKRRLVLFELDNYFNKNRTPVDVFGHLFFGSKWTEKDWSEFDKFMVDCSYMYMQAKDEKDEEGHYIGIIEPPQINYKRQLLDSKLPEDFTDWFEARINDIVIKMSYTELTKKDLYDEFRTKYEEYDNPRLYARAFAKWCKFYLEVMEIPSGEKRSTQDLLILYPNKSDNKVKMIYG